MAEDANAGSGSGSTTPASPRASRRGPWLVVLAVGALLILAAVMVPDGFALLRRREAGRYVLPDVPGLLRYLVMGLAVTMVLVALWGVVLSARGVGFARRRTWESKVLVLFVAVGLISYGAALRRGSAISVMVITVAAESVLPAQQTRIARAASLYLASRPGLARRGSRFDIVAIAPHALPVHHRDVWRP